MILRFGASLRPLWLVFAFIFGYLASISNAATPNATLADVLDHALPPIWFEEIGECNFLSTTNSSEVQRLFNQGGKNLPTLYIYSKSNFSGLPTQLLAF